MNLTHINEGLLLILYRLSQLEKQFSEPCSCSGDLVVEGKILEGSCKAKAWHFNSPLK
jgi:hypothetical protein